MKNFSKHIIFIFLMSISSFLLPYTSYACAVHNTSLKENHCTLKSKKKTESKSADDIRKYDTIDYQALCKHAFCSCGNLLHLPNITHSQEFNIKNPFDEMTKKNKFHFNQLEYSSGFISLWFPPKIS